MPRAGYNDAIGALQATPDDRRIKFHEGGLSHDIAMVGNDNWHVAGRAEDPETLLLRNTMAPELKAAVDELPEAFREAVWLRDVEEFSYAEIAEMLDIPIGTVMSRISRGRRMLFGRLQHLRPVNA